MAAGIPTTAHHVVRAAALLGPFPVVASQIIDIVGLGLFVGTGVSSVGVQRKTVVGVVAPRGTVRGHFLKGLAARVYEPL